MLRLRPGQIGFRCRRSCRKRQAIEPEQRIARADRCTLLVQALFNNAGHPRMHFDLPRTHRPAHVLPLDRHTVRLDRNDGDRRWRVRSHFLRITGTTQLNHSEKRKN